MDAPSRLVSCTPPGPCKWPALRPRRRSRRRARRRARAAAGIVGICRRHRRARTDPMMLWIVALMAPGSFAAGGRPAAPASTTASASSASRLDRDRPPRGLLQARRLRRGVAQAEAQAVQTQQRAEDAAGAGRRRAAEFFATTDPQIHATSSAAVGARKGCARSHFAGKTSGGRARARPGPARLVRWTPQARRGSAPPSRRRRARPELVLKSRQRPSSRSSSLCSEARPPGLIKTPRSA